MGFLSVVGNFVETNLDENLDADCKPESKIREEAKSIQRQAKGLSSALDWVRHSVLSQIAKRRRECRGDRRGPAFARQLD